MRYLADDEVRSPIVFIVPYSMPSRAARRPGRPPGRANVQRAAVRLPTRESLVIAREKCDYDTEFENSDVLPFGSVAVAVMKFAPDGGSAPR